MKRILSFRKGVSYILISLTSVALILTSCRTDQIPRRTAAPSSMVEALYRVQPYYKAGARESDLMQRYAGIRATKLSLLPIAAPRYEYEAEAMREALRQFGVLFPDGSTLVVLPETANIFVINAPGELHKIDSILKRSRFTRPNEE